MTKRNSAPCILSQHHFICYMISDVAYFMVDLTARQRTTRRSSLKIYILPPLLYIFTAKL